MPERKPEPARASQRPHPPEATHHAELGQLAGLAEENGVLARELGAAQARATRVVAERDMCIRRLTAENMQLRGALIGKETLAAGLRDEIARLETAIPRLRTRVEQACQIESQLDRIHDLERQLMRWQHRTQALEERIEHAPAAHARASTRPATPPERTIPALAALRDKAVLRVGGRAGIAPFYRQLVERTGGRFLQHDGGEDNHAPGLDASLAAADLVICQTGCVSHGAYWRVKDHCRRTGKRCVFVDQPNTNSLVRSLDGIERHDAETSDTTESGTACAACDPMQE